VSVIYDAGVLVAADRNNRRVWADHRVRLESGLVPLTTAPIVSQVSRSTRQAQLHRFLRGCQVLAFTAEQSHRVGALLRRARTADVIDAHLAIAASDTHSMVVTGDPVDLQHLSNHLDTPIRILTLTD
jgi:predicted 2-oxoglutarate/Fe(II)-dependent dioxygenase YbiX